MARLAGSASMSPAKAICTPFRSILGRSSRRLASMRRKSASTSCTGRLRKLSSEKANAVSACISLSSAHRSTSRLSASRPLLCPSSVGTRRLLAHLAFPSIITATCLGRHIFDDDDDDEDSVSSTFSLCFSSVANVEALFKISVSVSDDAATPVTSSNSAGEGEKKPVSVSVSVSGKEEESNQRPVRRGLVTASRTQRLKLLHEEGGTK
mmetsp:Transcript_2584/g.5821  ORF Transcript_2584/g.5821 Transcript_2584/m.5821 type:complete len:209 (-) Transcript_2584:111-737(-)